MPGDEVQFSADAANRHATSVDGVADAMRHARSAVHEVTMDSQAYGVLCQFLPGMLSPLFTLASTVLSTSATALGETAAALRTTATEMESTDTSSAERVRGSARRLELPL